MNAGLTYSWTLPDGSALPFTPTPSADPRKLIIPPSTLALGSSYTLRLNTVASNSVGVSTGYADVIITNVTAVRTRRHAWYAMRSRSWIGPAYDGLRSTTLSTGPCRCKNCWR